MSSEEKCPNCNFEYYSIDNYWDEFDEEGGVRVWECTCQNCNRKFDITYTYECTRINIG